MIWWAVTGRYVRVNDMAGSPRRYVRVGPLAYWGGWQVSILWGINFGMDVQICMHTQ